jgi:signal transduction histidine kinase
LRRSVNYASLKPGDYRFLVRAINAEGALSAALASAQFRVPAPFWQRWWFLAMAATAIGLAVYGLYRYRVARLVEIERVRTRIATDLHDDIGSNLSLIAGLSRFLRDQIGERDPGAGERLSVIAQASSRSVEAMSDIIWAVNPRKDHLSDLSQRMRRFASEAFTARDIEFSFTAPDLGRHTRVDAETRREVFLIFKEAVNNAVRHSACANAGVTLEVDHGKLVLKVSDDGKGFDQQTAEYGNGLMSIKARAEKLGGRLEIISAAGQGATVMLTTPLRHSPRTKPGY